MKRLFLRIGVLVTFVVLGLIAYAYAERGAGDRYSSDDSSVEDASPLRGPGAQNTSPNYTVNPLRDNTLRAGPVLDNSFDRTPVVDSRIKRVAADAPATESGARPAADPFGLTSHKGGSTVKQAAGQAIPNNGIPDAAALDPPPTGYPLAGDGADQSRYSQLAGPNLNSPIGGRTEFQPRRCGEQCRLFAVKAKSILPADGREISCRRRRGRSLCCR